MNVDISEGLHLFQARSDAAAAALVPGPPASGDADAPAHLICYHRTRLAVATT